MAGGAGTRLWPMSRKSRPKQLLPLIDGSSLLELAGKRLEGVVPQERWLICTGETHRQLIRETLPEIGKRTADTIIAELNGKVDRFLGPAPVGPGAAEPSGTAVVMRDAVAALTQLGEPKLHARQLVEQAFAENPALDTPDALVAAAYRVRAGEEHP